MTESFHAENGGSIVFRNVGIPPHHFTVSKPRRPRLKIVSAWKPRAMHHTGGLINTVILLLFYKVLRRSMSWNAESD